VTAQLTPVGARAIARELWVRSDSVTWN